MKKEIIYICDDGSRYNTEEEAKDYEQLCSEVASVMKDLKPLAYTNGEASNFVQHDIETVKKVFKSFMEICAKQIPTYKYTFIECGNGKRDISHASYILQGYGEENNCRKLDFILSRFYRISFKSGKEYTQPCFVINEDD